MNKIGRYRLIPDRRTGVDYLHRYYLFLKNRKTFPFNVMLHKIVRSDDPFMHDHPWPYLTIVLKGGYWEHNFDKNGNEIRTWRGPGSVIKRRAKEYHWLELQNEQPATTLFFVGLRVREWGFLDNDEWVHHEDFLQYEKTQTQ
jgi:hypothetical protein